MSTQSQEHREQSAESSLLQEMGRALARGLAAVAHPASDFLRTGDGGVPPILLLFEWEGSP